MRYKQNWKLNYYRDWLYHQHRLSEQTTESLPILLNDTLLRVLERSRNVAQLNSALTPATERAYGLAKQWAIWAVVSYGEYLPPYIAIPGDGALVIEWETVSGTVSVRFDGDDDDTDLIISRFGETRSVEAFNADTLKTKLDRLITQNATPSRTFTRPNYTRVEDIAYSSKRLPFKGQRPTFATA